MLVVIDRLRHARADLNARVVGPIQYRPFARSLLSLPHKKSANAYNISTRHFASGTGIADAAAWRPCSMTVHRG
ncbi:MAG TPA: hypothetical protein VFQ87_18365 [Bradyrhizobium sp.]|jgi:hypothetical protein|nr:hypothetical protein [Bradyrhizobium sp.]